MRNSPFMACVYYIDSRRKPITEFVGCGIAGQVLLQKHKNAIGSMTNRLQAHTLNACRA